MRRPAFAALLAIILAALPAGEALAQRGQTQDPAWNFDNKSPAWPAGSGKAIVISGHSSPIVQNGSMEPFARLAASDGFNVRTEQGSVAAAIDGAEILVIANAYRQDFAQFPAMTPPSAFSDAEIAAIRGFIENGGSLLLLADHAPLGGGASALAAAFGFDFLNGHLVEEARAKTGYARVIIDFTPQDGLATDHPATDGSTGRAPIARFHCFGGQAFIPPAGAKTLLQVPQGWSVVFSYRLRDDLAAGPRLDASGMAQGAAMEFGKGRIAVFAETGAFTAQLLPGDRPMGLNTIEGRDNPEFILALLRWLAGYTPGG
jgi:hypothetical protein